jgi:hypothetical protein
MTRALVLAAVAAAALTSAAPASAVPILASETVRGTGTTTALAPVAPTAKTVDGLIGDWTGTNPGYGGVSLRSHGELVYADHLFDAYGADDGHDKEYLDRWGPVESAVPETYRIGAIAQNDPAGEFGIPAPDQIRYHTNYGDLDRSDRSDITELRLATAGDDLFFLARTATMTTANDVAMLVLLDTAAGDTERTVPFGSGLKTRKAEYAIQLEGASGKVANLATGAVTDLPAGSVATNPDGWTNAVEARFSRSALGIGDSVGVAAAARKPGGPVANVGFRHMEPVREWFDKNQALALLAQNIDQFFESTDLAPLRAGATEAYQPGPGYHDRHFRSSELISRESGEDGILQHYGVFLPAGYDPAKTSPLQLWLHWRGGTAHSAGHTVPRMFRDLGDAHGTIVVSPRGRGTSSWYVGRGQVDVEQVWKDIHETFKLDPRHQYVAGHSMGGWGSFLMTIIHPDWFAAALPASPPVTQGAWTGVDIGEQCDGYKYDDYSPCYIEANGSDPRAQHTIKLLENVRHVPWAIYAGVEDELVPYPGVARQVARLVQLGYRHRFYSFATQEHYGPPVWDEWADGGNYMHQFTAPENPAQVSYVRDMPFERATETVNNGGIPLSFDFDHAYWMSGLTPNDLTAGHAVFEGRSLAIADAPALTAPDAGGPAAVGNAGPFVMTGLQWLQNPVGAAAPTSNAYTATLTAARAVTLDGARMKLDAGKAITGTVTADGPLKLGLGGFASTPVVTVNGAPAAATRTGGVVTVDLPSGKSTVVYAPAGAGLRLR